MMEDFERVVNKEWYIKDLKALTSQIMEQESLLRLKRRWLMDLPLSKGEQERVEEVLPPNDKILPESFLREDDVSYEDIRTCIETAFGAHTCGKEPQLVHRDVSIPNLHDGLQEIFLLLDAMTNKGLYSFVKILTGGVIKFEKTNWSMKRTIKELLPEVIADKSDISKTKRKQLFQLLQDPNSFRGNQVVLTTPSTAYSAAALKVLEGLEDFPSRALSAMQRKLRGVKGYIPSMKPSKSGQGRDNLVSRVKKRCMNMLSSISEVNEPSEQLAGALGVAGLTLKLMMTRPVVKELGKFSPETEALQNDIVKAIHLLNDAKKVSLIELRKVQILLDPNCELSVRSLRMAVRNLLTEYLYECSDMDKVPECLFETLDIINRRSQLPSRRKRSSSEGYSSPQKLMKEVIEKEIECLLNISAQAKEVVSNLLHKQEFDEEFAHAYMEDYEASDTFCVSDDEQVGVTSQHFEIHSYNSYVQEESIGETNPTESNSPISTSKRDGCSRLSPLGRLNLHLESTPVTKMDSDKTYGLDSQCVTQKQYSSRCSEELGNAYSDSVKMTTKQNLSSLSHSPARNSSYNALKSEETTSCSLATEETDMSLRSRSANEYLEVQEACDITSMVAYRFVGCMLDKLAKTENLVLYQGDRLYLHSYSSFPEDSEEYEHTLLASKFSEMWENVLQR